VFNSEQFKRLRFNPRGSEESQSLLQEMVESGNQKVEPIQPMHIREYNQAVFEDQE
jgi:hypothetical protein